MMKDNRFFINADDFCLSIDINDAIIELANKNKIDSTTVIVNNRKIPLKESINKLNGLSIGLHLNLSEGKPISDDKLVSSLINKNRVFYPHKTLWIRYILGRVKKKEIQLEISNQYSLLSKLTTISHVDSHKQIHSYPYLGDFILKCLLDIGVSKIRNPYPIYFKQKRYYLIRLFCKRRKWKKMAANFKKPEGLISLVEVKNLPNLLSQYKNDNVEIMAHPSIRHEGGYIDNYQDYINLLNI